MVEVFSGLHTVRIADADGLDTEVYIIECEDGLVLVDAPRAEIYPHAGDHVRLVKPVCRRRIVHGIQRPAFEARQRHIRRVHDHPLDRVDRDQVRAGESLILDPGT